ncbi:class I SAM-dependent methyltransferase [Actinomyces wuliandei]|uniref:class I SAM-dependent methyltransferase n=1 Tax=Actinomyces wuliandei TaxID=2057743 RepID=UPI000FD9E9A4|nr:methyltransferase [Actinomyces wuliandei]
MNEHYFTASPSGSAQERTRRVVVRGTDYEVVTTSGVFSADRLDRGTRVLLHHVPQPPTHGTFLDLGCGWGPIALALARASPQALVLATDVNERAVELTRRNAAGAGLTNISPCLADDLRRRLTQSGQRLDLIWSNPPVRIGKRALHDLLTTWLSLLSEHGEAWLVVSRNLGADSLTRWLVEEGWQAGRTASAKGFRVLRVARS